MVGSDVAVKVSKKEETLASGFILSRDDVAGKEKNYINYGVVTHIGPDVKEVSVGERVAFIEGTYWKNDKRINKHEFEVDGEAYVRVPERDIKAIIEE